MTTRVERPLILVIEDDATISELLDEVFTAHGYRAISAANVNDAMRHMESVCPALITLDLRLPGISGKMFLRLIRENPEYRQIPVIVVSAEWHIEPEIRRLVQGTVRKPFEIDDLLVEVGRVFAQTRRQGRLEEAA